MKDKSKLVVDIILGIVGLAAMIYAIIINNSAMELFGAFFFFGSYIDVVITKSNEIKNQHKR